LPIPKLCPTMKRLRSRRASTTHRHRIPVFALQLANYGY